MLLQENVRRVDPATSLGLGPECVQSYRVGDQLRTVGSTSKNSVSLAFVWALRDTMTATNFAFCPSLHLFGIKLSPLLLPSKIMSAKSANSQVCPSVFAFFLSLFSR